MECQALFSQKKIVVSSGQVQTTNLYFSYFFQKIYFDISHKLPPFGDNLYEMSKTIFWEKLEETI